MSKTRTWTAVLTLGLAWLAGISAMAPAVAETPATSEAAQSDAAEEAPPIWTPELTMRYRLITATAITADGSRVAYVVRHPEMEGEKSELTSRIRVAAADGSSDARYTSADRSSDAPAFSPDGRHLAFLSKRPGDEEAKTQVWIMRVDGGEAESLTEAESDVTAFRWSPDGKSIAFLAADPETEDEETEKKEKRDVILVHQQFKYSHLYVQEVNSSETAEPTESGEARRITEGAFHVDSFDWSPDSTTLVFSHQADPLINTGFIERDISSVPAAGGEVTPLVERPGVDTGPLYSPDGHWIAFTSHGGTQQPIGLADVWVITADGTTEPRALAHTHDRRAQLLGWSGDGKDVLLFEARGTTTQIAALPADGGPARDVTDLGGSLSAISLARDGEHLAFAWETADFPPEVHVAPRQDFQMRCLSTVNQDVPRPPMGQTERLAWKSFDGREIEGLITYPVGYEKGQRVPLVLVVHGGPAGVFRQHFTGSPGIYQIQVFAQQGYALLRPNPRGSTGYGKEFRYANVRDWGYGDYEDLMSGVDLAIERGIADPEQLYVMGWSYGGYMTSFVVTRTGRFRAASMGAGLPNLVSMVHTTDIPDYLVGHMGAELWDDYEVFEKHSAMYRIGKVVTPTQVIHGAEDLRVPFDQGRELFLALERRGIPTEMVVYPRTPHGPREPKYIMDVSRRILDWFERHQGR
ncbi:MAG: S9 family peptidase [bacterium]|nr:S9 family peptidase [bacterium]